MWSAKTLKKLLANTSRTSCLMQFVQYVSRNIFFSADLSQQLFPLRIQKTFWILAILNTTRDRHYASIIIIIMFDILMTVFFLKYKKQDHVMAWLSSILESIWFFSVIQFSFTFLWPPPLLLKIWMKLFSELFQQPCTSNRHLLVQSQWGKHQKKVWNLFR